MASRIQCFLLERTDRVRVKLRRYSRDDNCPAGPMRCHDGSVLLPGPLDGDWSDRRRLDGLHGDFEDLRPPQDDARWPTKCEQCGAELAADTHWQVFVETLWRRVDTGALLLLRDAPPGAMWDADWWPEKGPDGRALHICLPPNGGHDYWHVDGPANNGPGWTRTGEPPLVTANPSILTPRYHGYLRNGWLEEC